jgi:glycosyltransferase involved in cell wall biosynthesis
VIASTGSCLSEAGGPGSIYVNPSSEEELADQLEKVLSDANLRNQMIAQGKKFIKQFDANVIAEKVIGVYKDCS